MRWLSIARSGWARDVSVQSGAVVVSQLVQLVAGVATARLYDPDVFGGFSTVLAWGNILAVLMTLRLEAAIPLAESDDEARQLTHASIAAASGIFAATTAFAVITIAIQPEARAVGPIISAALIGWVTAIWSALVALHSRIGSFSRIATSTVASSVVLGGSQVGLGAIAPSESSLVIGQLAGRAASVIMLLRGVGLAQRFGIRLLVRRAIQWRRMPTHLLIPALLNAASVSSVVAVVSLLYGAQFAGYFALALRMLAVPGALVGQAVARVFYPRVAALHRAGADTGSIVGRLAAVLLAISTPVFVLVFATGPELFALVFGPEWREAGVVASICAPWIALQFVSSPISSYATVRDRLGILFILAFVEFGARIVALWVGLWAGSPLLGTALYSLVGVGISIYFTIWVFRLSGVATTSWLRLAGPFMLAATIGCGVLLLLRTATTTGVLVVASSAFTAVLAVWAVRLAGRAAAPEGPQPGSGQ